MKKKLLVAVLGAIALLLFTVFKDVSVLVLFSFVQAYIILPIVKYFEKYMRSSLAILLSFLITAVINTAVIILLVPIFINQAREFVALIPEYSVSISAYLNKVPFLNKVPINSILEKFAERTAFSFNGIFSFISLSLLMPVAVFYFLRDRVRIKNFLLFLLPEKIRDTAFSLCLDINGFLRDYIFGETVIAVVLSLLTALLLLLFGFKYWLLLGIIMGIFNIVPYIGPVIATVPIILSALPDGAEKTFIGLVIAIAVQQADNLIIRPRVISSTLEVHPLTVILCITAGNCIGSVGGMLLAVPLYITARTVFRELYKIFSERNCKFRKKSKI